MTTRHSLAGLVVALVVLGCGGPGPRVAPPSSAPSEPRQEFRPVLEPVTGNRYVLVWRDAHLYRAPEEGSAALRSATDMERRPGAVFSFRILRSSDTWLEVEAPRAEVERHLCHPSPPGWAGSGVRLFVRRTETVPATLSEMELRFPDGSSLRIPPGVHAAPFEREGGNVVLGGGSVGIPIELPESEIGSHFLPGSTQLQPRSKLPHLDNGPSVGGQPLIDQRRAGEETETYCDSIQPVYASKPDWSQETPSRAVIRVEGLRAQIVGKVEWGKGRWQPCRGCCAPECRGTSRGRYWRPRRRLIGPALFWPTGERAGLASSDLYMEEIRRVGKRWCGNLVGESGGGKGTLRVCVDVEHVGFYMGRWHNEEEAAERIPQHVVNARLAPHVDELARCLHPEHREYLSFVVAKGGLYDLRPHWEASDDERRCLKSVLSQMRFPGRFSATRVKISNLGAAL